MHFSLILAAPSSKSAVMSRRMPIQAIGTTTRWRQISKSPDRICGQPVPQKWRRNGHESARAINPSAERPAIVDVSDVPFSAFGLEGGLREVHGESGCLTGQLHQFIVSEMRFLKQTCRHGGYPTAQRFARSRDTRPEMLSVSAPVLGAS